jgi:hypothetical protein
MNAGIPNYVFSHGCVPEERRVMQVPILGGLSKFFYDSSFDNHSRR